MLKTENPANELLLSEIAVYTHCIVPYAMYSHAFQSSKHVYDPGVWGPPKLLPPAYA